MSNKELLDAIEALTIKFDQFTTETKANFAKLEAKKTTRSTGGGAKKAASTTPTGKRFPNNFMFWYKNMYQSEPEKALELVPATIKDQLEDFKNTADEKYNKKNAAGQRSAEATFIWKAIGDETKANLKAIYVTAKKEFLKNEREEATVETDDESSSPMDVNDAAEDTSVPVSRQRRGNKRQVVVE